MNPRVHPRSHEQDMLPGLEGDSLGSYHFKILSDIPSKTGEEIRSDYVNYTERLIAEAITDQVDTMVFLDKSARPVAWLMKELWPTLGIDNNGDAVEMPEIKFVNIDREQWAPMLGRSEVKTGGIDFSRLHPHTIDSLRGLFSEKLIEPMEDFPDDEPTMFDGKNVRITDEVEASGDTLRIAKGIFERAFPEATISGKSWMSNPMRIDRKTNIRSNVVPVWYRDDTLYGRGVGDRKINNSESSPSNKQRRGSQFLSTRHPRVDEDANQLRKEFKVLAAQVERGLMPVTPHSSRSTEAMMKMVESVNGITVPEFRRLKNEAERTGETFVSVYRQYKLDLKKRFSS